jgi:hypothetical protein
MLLCELKILRELDGRPVSDAVNAVSSAWKDGWQGMGRGRDHDAPGEAEDKSTDAVETKEIHTDIRPLIEAMVSYPIDTSKISHTALQTLLSTDDAKRKAAEGVAAFKVIIEAMAAKYAERLRAIKDQGLEERVKAVKKVPFDSWVRSIQQEMDVKLDHPSIRLTRDADTIKRIKSVLAAKRPIIIEAAMSGRGAIDLAISSAKIIGDAIEDQRHDESSLDGKTRAANAERSVITAEGFFSFCRALLENQFQAERAISPFVKGIDLTQKAKPTQKQVANPANSSASLKASPDDDGSLALKAK